jgi:malate dehydrogenase (oxaloacetate-decarboxylating)
MKVSVELSLEIRNRKLAECVARLSGAGCDISRVVSTGKDLTSTVYQIDLVYDDTASFKRCLASFTEEPENFRVISLKNHLEEFLTGSFITVQGSFKIESPDNYDMNILGVRRLAHEKMNESDNPLQFTGIKKNVAFVTGVRGNTERETHSRAIHYVDCEIGAAIFAKFSGMNGIPILIRYDKSEDLLKTLSAIEPGFSAMRFSHLDDDDTPDIYEQLPDTISIPYISYRNDEIPAFALAGILKMIKKHRYKLSESNIGFIGLDASSIRLSRLCLRAGCMRVLGFDNNEKSMLHFERQKGLATTPEHIFSNSDIVIIMKSHFTQNDLSKMRPGIVVLSFLEDETPLSFFQEKRTCREIVSGEWADTALIYPGMIRGFLASGRQSSDDEMIIALAKMLAATESPDGKLFPHIFSDIHEKAEAVASHRDERV